MARELPPPLPAQDIAALALRVITELTGKKPLGATSVMPTDEGWTVEVEVVEDRRLPQSPAGGDGWRTSVDESRGNPRAGTRQGPGSRSAAVTD